MGFLRSIDGANLTASLPSRSRRVCDLDGGMCGDTVNLIRHGSVHIFDSTYNFRENYPGQTKTGTKIKAIVSMAYNNGFLGFIETMHNDVAYCRK